MKTLIFISLLVTFGMGYMIGFNSGMNRGESVTLQFNSQCRK